jgi:hypothetical protein
MTNEELEAWKAEIDLAKGWDGLGRIAASTHRPTLDARTELGDYFGEACMRVSKDGDR